MKTGHSKAIVFYKPFECCATPELDMTAMPKRCVMMVPLASHCYREVFEITVIGGAENKISTGNQNGVSILN